MDTDHAAANANERETSRPASERSSPPCACLRRSRGSGSIRYRLPSAARGCPPRKDRTHRTPLRCRSCQERTAAARWRRLASAVVAGRARGGVTAAQLAQRGVATDHEFRGAQTRRRGKKHVNPSFNRTPHAHPLAGDYVEPEAPRVLTQSNVLMGATATADKQPFRAGSLAGYRSRQFAPGAKSMISATISGIAKSMPPPQRTAKSDNGSWTSHNKEILDRDNYRPDGVLPGFTGTFRR